MPDFKTIHNNGGSAKLATYYQKDSENPFDEIDSKYRDKGPHVDPEMRLFAIAVAKGIMSEDEGVDALLRSESKKPITSPAKPLERDSDDLKRVKTYGWMVAVNLMEYDEALHILEKGMELRDGPPKDPAEIVRQADKHEKIVNQLWKQVDVNRKREDAAWDWKVQYIKTSFHRAVAIETVRLDKGATLAEPRLDTNPAVSRALGLDPTRPLTHSELANVLSGMRTDGEKVPGKRYTDGTDFRSSTTAIDVVVSADKSVSVAWATAPNGAERAMILQAFRNSVDSTAEFISSKIGEARSRAGNQIGHVTWIKFEHLTSRPADENNIADPNLHTHIVIPNLVVTNSGRVFALNSLELGKNSKEITSHFHQQIEHEFRKIGAEVSVDEKTGVARLTAIPDHVREHFSKRSQNIEEAARAYSESKGVSWDSLDKEQQKRLMSSQATINRQPSEGLPNFKSWEQQSEDLNFWNRRGVVHQVEPTTTEVTKTISPPPQPSVEQAAGFVQAAKELKQKVQETRQETDLSIERNIRFGNPETSLHVALEQTREIGIMKEVVSRLENWRDRAVETVSKLTDRISQMYRGSERQQDRVQEKSDRSRRGRSDPEIPM